MRAFELARPTTPQEAVQLLDGPAGQHLALAGGQDVLSLMKENVAQPDRLVNLKSIPGLRKIEVNREGKLVVGALVTLAELAESELVQKGWPTLAEAALTAATPQIRNLATVGGNLNQRPRCWYYRCETLVCMRKGGDACLAAIGEHRYHAIFAEGLCHNPNMASLATPLLAHEAVAEVYGSAGKRYVAIKDLYDPLGGDIRVDTNLAPSELVTQVIVPPSGGWSFAHEEVRYRQSYDWPLAMATVALSLQGGVVQEARVALGAVAPKPILSTAAADALRGRRVDEAVAAAAGQAAVRGAQPLEQNGFKVTLTANLVRRTVLAAAAKGEG